jgi:hypothetical protein
MNNDFKIEKSDVNNFRILIQNYCDLQTFSNEFKKKLLILRYNNTNTNTNTNINNYYYYYFKSFYLNNNNNNFKLQKKIIETIIFEILIRNVIYDYQYIMINSIITHLMNIYNNNDSKIIVIFLFTELLDKLFIIKNNNIYRNLIIDDLNNFFQNQIYNDFQNTFQNLWNIYYSDYRQHLSFPPNKITGNHNVNPNTINTPVNSSVINTSVINTSVKNPVGNSAEKLNGNPVGNSINSIKINPTGNYTSLNSPSFTRNSTNLNRTKNFNTKIKQASNFFNKRLLKNGFKRLQKYAKEKTQKQEREKIKQASTFFTKGLLKNGVKRLQNHAKQQLVKKLNFSKILMSKNKFPKSKNFVKLNTINEKNSEENNSEENKPTKIIFTTKNNINIKGNKK